MRCSHICSRMKRGIDYLNVDVGTARPSHSDVDAALLTACSMGHVVPKPRMPWESTPLMRHVMKRESMPWLKTMKIHRALPTAALSHVIEPVFAIDKKIAIRESCAMQVGRKRDLERDNVLLKWVEALLLLPDRSRVGKQLMAVEVASENCGRHLQIVADSLQGKATRTLALRVSSLVLYIKWHKSVDPDGSFLPFDEDVVYNYMCHLRDSSCSASRGTTFISTMSFCRDILGMEGAGDCVSSARISGAALSMFLMKRPLKQAPPLVPYMLAVLEVASFFDSNAYVRCLAGFCLCCIYGRMRVSDMNRIANMEVRGEFAELCLLRVKTARTKEKQTTFLPSVIPCRGVLGINWFAAFLFNRKFLGLEDFPSPNSVARVDNFVVLPSESSLPLDNYVKVATSEVTNGLRTILGRVCAFEVVRNFTSHSLKTTLLTYLGIMGCDYTYTELLGYHLTQHRSAINYQRNALSAPLRYMCDMLYKVREGVFVPLAPRDEVFPEEHRDIILQIRDVLGLDLESLIEMFLGHAVYEVETENCRPEVKHLWKVLQDDMGVSQSDEPMEHHGTVEPRAKEPASSTVHVHDVSSSSDEIEASPTDEDTDSCSSSAESAFAEVARNNGGARLQSKFAISEILYRHARTKMVHMANAENSAKTACGRMVGSTYNRYYGDVERAWPHCVQCFGNL